MNNPILIVEDDFSQAWAKAIIELKKQNWDAWNFVVTIKNPEIINYDAVEILNDFAKKENLVTPSQVQHTIFPSRFYKGERIHDKEKFYHCYNKFYKYTRKQPHSGWGTYFKRMISYYTKDGKEYDQLGNIIKHINDRNVNYGCSHFMIIPQVGRESNMIMGSPCLNYIAIQVEKQNNQKIINLLALYRNHDYRKRTFGNYWGLCELLKYICVETNSTVGSLTCVSSHAFVSNSKKELYKISNKILGE